MNRLSAETENIMKLCKIYNVKSLYAFGSVLTERIGNNSDIDLIVDFEDMYVEDYADNYFDFKFSLQNLLKRPIDLLEDQSIKNPYFRQTVNLQKQLIYAQ